MKYKIKLEQFEGPLDLLLDLIEARKLSISSVSLARITEEYVKHVKTLKDFPREEVADFLVVASTLMLIKSRALLPGLELSAQEEEDISDLELRLKFLQRIRELSANIKTGWQKHPLFSRESFQGINFGFIAPVNLKISDLEKALADLVKAFPKLSLLPQKTLEKVVSIEEKMVELVSRLSERLKSSFHDLVKSKNKLDVIVGFLALLELVKQGALLVKQEERFGKIELRKLKAGE
ncbi:segregation/condensation protein A [Candidatus Giovannonibacteria bacterium]|nr:segregation/condensation protein A [Candidatus Giovannonibacteria bacterium]